MTRSIALAVLLTACGGAGEVRQLETLGVRIQPREAGWYRLRSEAGYSFELPGVPLAEREEYGLGGARIPALFYDLSAEMSSRGFLVRAFDARALDDAEREELRRLAEEQIARAGETISDRREVRDAGVTVHQIVVEPVTMYGHLALVRTFVRGPFVFQLVAIILPGDGEPGDAERMFRSIQLEGDRPAIPADPALIPAEAPDD